MVAAQKVSVDDRRKTALLNNGMPAVKAFLMSLLSFCRIDLPPEARNFGSSLEIVRYENGKAISKEVFNQQNPKYRAVMTFLKSNTGSWKHDIASHAPVILIKGNGIVLNCLKANAVIHYTDAHGNPVQLSLDTGPITYCGIG